MKIDLTSHSVLHLGTEMGWSRRTFRAKVTRVIGADQVEIEVGGQRVRVRTQVALEEGTTLLLRSLPDKKTLQLLQIIPKRSDFSFLSSLDLFETQAKTIVALANFDERLKHKLIERIFDSATQRKLLELHAKISEILAKVPMDSRLALLAERIGPKKPKAEDIERSLFLHKKEHEAIVQALRSLAQDLPDRATADMVMDVVQMLQNYWLLGQMSNAYIGYLPLDWPELEESRIVIKRLTSRPVYLCKIHLGFVDRGQVDVTLVLHRRYLSVVMGIEDEIYRRILHRSRHELKLQLQALGVVANILVKKFVQEDIGSFLAKENFMDLRA